MKLDIVDTVLSSFNRIASKASLGVIGFMIALLVILGAGFTAGAALMTVSTILGGAVMALTLIGYIVGAAALSVGTFRAFDQKDISKSMFTENILWPFLRMTGANITIQAFAFTAAYLLIYPLLLIGVLGGSMAGLGSSSSAASLAGAGTGLLAIGGILGLISLGIILYLLATLIISVPRITVDDKRLFQALDESVQSTKGNRARIIATILPFVVLLVIGGASMALLGEILGTVAYLLTVVVGSLYMPAILTELNSRLE
ncbi:glycerophosphoryl diester phosphodiesterase membrane domain-containing protein [Candidatus Nanohalobium constans]|uniref:Glycerophosphoryl diester phosphodiesterase membrane domain-containing protein n=1 Tax=Candidatus Nanohalobium constans TaxID=2565781 RepID=A0A5Q0UEK5_9ARCH|nr:glycerophosphoryl diester phosphodiesterase membrane domain-containing protein [Candidatus Nanohalobium constans]QGA80003.1 hypothetical protein LC1Nh_0095 [Candidatus Nanohalobium constans]